MTQPNEINSGYCPVCGQRDEYLNSNGNLWWICHQHKLKWFAGTSQSSHSQCTTESNGWKNSILLSQYRDVEPTPPRTLRQWKQLLSNKPKEEKINLTIRNEGNLKGIAKEINLVNPEILRSRLIETMDRFAFMALYRVAEDCQEATNTILNILRPHQSEPATNRKDVTFTELQTRLSYKRILVIDDDPTVRASCIRIFSQHDFQVEVAASAKEGLERTMRGYFDCALIDLKMPDGDGMEIVRSVRENHSNMAILIITGYSTDESAAEATRLGVSDYLNKPFTPKELVDAVEKAIQVDG